MNRTTKETVLRAVGYVRVSTVSQSREGVSLDAQEARVRAAAALHGADLLDVVRDEAASGKDLNRSGADRILRLVRDRSVDVVIVAKLDRLTRSVRDLCDLVELFQKKRVSLLSVAESIDTGTAAGRMVVNMLAAVAQWEREAIGERTAASLRQKALRGEYTGGAPPYGYRLAADGVRLEPHEGEQAIIEIARELRREGLSIRAVVAALTERGVRSRSGRPFGIEQVWKMVP